MKKIGLIFILFLAIIITGNGQTRYFEFTTDCPGNLWQDHSFIAATSDQTVIDSVLENLNRPLNERQLIIGSIDYGHGGYNGNGNFWFSWHFIPNQWVLSDAAMEVCDGCPLAADVAGVGIFCPWSSAPIGEVFPLGITEQILENEILLYPNPANNKINLKWNSSNNISVTIYNSIGQELSKFYLDKQEPTIDITSLQEGVYFLKITDKNEIRVKKIVVEKK